MKAIRNIYEAEGNGGYNGFLCAANQVSYRLCEGRREATQWCHEMVEYAGGIKSVHVLPVDNQHGDHSCTVMIYEHGYIESSCPCKPRYDIQDGVTIIIHEDR